MRFHPLLLLLASLLSLYPASATIASPDQIVRPFIVLSVVLAMLQWTTAQFINKDASAVIVTIFVLSMCSSPSFASEATTWSLIALCLAWIIVRFRKRPAVVPANTVLSLVGASLVVTLAIPFAKTLSPLMTAHARLPLVPTVRMKSTNARPDIYYIVLDSYSRSDVLLELYGFDNSPFVEFLEARNFVVPKQSRSNYAKTVLSVTSTLNMEYVETLLPSRNAHRYWWLMSPYFERNRVRLALEHIGYRSVSVASGWHLTDNATTQTYISGYHPVLTDFEQFLIARTPLTVMNPLLKRFEIAPSYDSHRAAILSTFDTLQQLPKLPGPKFVFAHVFAPHPPFVFDATGNPAEPSYPFAFHDANYFPMDASHYREGYVQQLRFVNSRLKQVVDTILSASATPPIIVLQADHGPRMLGDFGSYESTCLKEAFSTFSAYYLPGVRGNLIPADVSAVNLFRIILNEYFAGSLPLLESKNFYDDSSYLLADVTEQVNTCAKVE